MLRKLCLVALFATAAVASTVGGIWVQDRTVPVFGQVVEVYGDAHPGGKLRIKWQVYRWRACAATKSEIIVDTGSARWILPQQYFAGPPGPLGLDSYITQTELPHDIPPGPAKLRVLIAYMCNPVHKLWPVLEVVPDVDFEITPGR